MKKRVSLSLSDDDINLLYAAMCSYAPDAPEEDGELFDKLCDRLLVARGKVRKP